MKHRLLVLTAVAPLIVMMACASTGGDSASGDRFRGRIAALSGPGGGEATYFDFHAHRYATDDEVKALTDILVEDGEKALHKAVTDLEPMGWFRLGTNTRYHLRLVRSIPTPNGRIIRAITDRQIFFGEVAGSRRSQQYSFGIVELQLDNNDEGAGGIIPAAKLSFAGTTIEFESLGSQPYRIMGVKREK